MKCYNLLLLILLISVIDFSYQGKIRIKNKLRHRLRHQKNQYEAVYARHHNKMQNKNMPGLMIKDNVDGTAATLTATTIIDRHAESLRTRQTDTSMCVLKQGYLHSIDNQDVLPDQSVPQMFGRPNYVVINRATIAIFLNENVDNVINTMPLDHMNIPKRPKQWVNVESQPAYEVFSEETDTVDTKPGTINLCANTPEELQEWLDAFQKFHMCAVTPGGAGNLKHKEVVEVNDDQDGTAADQDVQDQFVREGEKVDIKDDLDEIETDLKMQEAMIKRSDRQSQQVLDAETQKTRALETEKECLQKSLSSNQYMKDRFNIRVMMEAEKKKAETIIKVAQQKIKENNQKLNMKINKEKQLLIDQQKKKQEEIRENMTKMAVKNQVSTETNRCFDLKNPYYQMLGVCAEVQPKGDVPDPSVLNDCMEKKNFCRYCCDYFVGPLKSDEEFKQNCYKRCETNLNPPKGIQQGVEEGEQIVHVGDLQSLKWNIKHADGAAASDADAGAAAF